MNRLLHRCAVDKCRGQLTHLLHWQVRLFYTTAAYQQATWKWLEQEGARFDRQLKELPGLTVYPGRANYRLLRCDRADFDLQRAMLEQHVLIRSCANYPGLDARYYRVAVRSQEENNRLLAALRKVLSGTTPAD